jgi:hypothetical protein
MSAEALPVTFAIQFTFSDLFLPFPASALNSIELDLLPLPTRDVTRLHPRIQFGNDNGRHTSVRWQDSAAGHASTGATWHNVCAPRITEGPCLDRWGVFAGVAQPRDRLDVRVGASRNFVEMALRTKPEDERRHRGVEFPAYDALSAGRLGLGRFQRLIS